MFYAHNFWLPWPCKTCPELFFVLLSGLTYPHLITPELFKFPRLSKISKNCCNLLLKITKEKHGKNVGVISANLFFLPFDYIVGHQFPSRHQ